MSGGSRRRRRHPARVYWVRRAVLVVPVVAVGLLTWWVVPGGKAGRDAAFGSGAPAAGPTVATSTWSATHRGVSKAGPVDSEPSRGRVGTAGTPTETQPVPSRECSPSGVNISVTAKASNSSPGASLSLELTPGQDSGCVLAVTPRVLAMQVANAAGAVWSSQNCPNEMPARNVVLRPGVSGRYTFQWDGRGNESGCRSTGSLPRGRYVVRAAFIGGPLATARLILNRP
ncbi:MAG TPA: hypothetical protein VFI30_02445 [Nocardioidaceae bacterium]|nr:hypothetical protein [Nocardioidaceae bacterium]